jgi:hypothetical protein
VLVAQTDRVREAISRGILREVTGKREPTPARIQIVDMLNDGRLNFTPPPQPTLIDADQLVAEVNRVMGGGQTSKGRG